MIMKLTSPKTYRVVRFALENQLFRQYEVPKQVGVSFGIVNRTVNWMVSRGFASKSNKGYQVNAPAALANAFALFRKMEDQRIGVFEIEAKKEDIQEALDKMGATACLSTALAYYDDYLRDPAICVYGDEKIIQFLRQARPGSTRVEVYEDDLKQEDDFSIIKGKRVTKRVRTIIDLLCSFRAYGAENLIRNTWK
jgi:hypothetical protein